MNLSGLGTKILAPIEKNSEIIGGGYALLQVGTSGSLVESISRLISGNVHGPDVTAILGRLREDPVYASTVFAIIGGHLAQHSGVGLVDKLGKIAVKAGSAYLAVRIADLVLYNCTHSGPGGASALAQGYSY